MTKEEDIEDRNEIAKRWVSLPSKTTEILVLNYIYQECVNNHNARVATRKIIENVPASGKKTRSRTSQVLKYLVDLKLIYSDAALIPTSQLVMKLYCITPQGKEFFEELLRHIKKCGEIADKYNVGKPS